MWIFYICALIPLAVGAFFLWKDDQVVWWEWLIGAAAAFLLAGIMHMTSIMGMTADIETWSGQIIKVSHYPRWVEEYQERHEETYTTGSGEDEETHTRVWYTTEYDTHEEHWVAYRDFGAYQDDVDFEQSDFNEVSHHFGGKIFNDGKQSYDHGGSFDSGDRNIYSVINERGYLEPVTTIRKFENRIKAAPTLFSFSTVPTNIAVYPWPDNPDWRKSDRLLGSAAVLINRYKWDCMNSTLGPRKRVNVIMIGFTKESSDYGQWQQAKYIGGKKNDLVICFGGATKNKPAQWAYVFGWTENELVKQNLQTIVTQNPIDDNIIPLISTEIQKNYVIKDWHKFDYITIQPPVWSYWVYFILLILTQGVLYVFFHKNEYGKNYASQRWGHQHWR